MDRQNDDNDKPLSFREMLQSVLAAAFGVQSGKNREKDFKARSPAKFIFMGAVMVCVFVTCVLFAVRCSMQQAGLAN